MTKHKYEYAYPVPLPASRADVFTALSDAGALRTWFAEHVEIQTGVGGAFRFWGRHTYGVPGAEQATQTLLRFEPDTALAFSWRLLDRDSEVTWALDEQTGDDGATTKITVTHEFESLPSVGRAEALIDDLWRIHTGNLCFYLHGNTDMFRPDFTDDSPEIRCEIVIDAPPDKVFAALTVPDNIKQWFPAPAPVVEPRVGGKYGFGFSFEMDGQTIEPPPMTIAEYVENERLTMNWPDWRMDPNVPDQTISWRLEDLGGKTRLTLLHYGFTRTVDVSDYPFGWQEFLDKIATVAQAL